MTTRRDIERRLSEIDAEQSSIAEWVEEYIDTRSPDDPPDDLENPVRIRVYENDHYWIGVHAEESAIPEWIDVDEDLPV